MRGVRMLGVYWGVGLLVVGLFFTLFSLGVFAQYETAMQWGATVLLGGAGLAFLMYFALRPVAWWSLIPGFSLLALAAITFLGMRQQVESTLLAGVLFAGLALAYLTIFVVDRVRNWWAWIPAGSFLVLVPVLLLAPRWGERVAGGLLFGGMALVFYLLYALAPAAVQHWWALLVATVFALFAIFMLLLGVDRTSWAGRFWPLGLIALGVALLAWDLARLLSRPSALITRASAPLAPPASATGDGDSLPVPETLPPRRPADTAPEPSEGSARGGEDMVTGQQNDG